MSEILLTNQAPPATPAPGRVAFYMSASGIPTIKNELGITIPFNNAIDRYINKNIAGGLDITLTPIEEAYGIFEFTGVLTANINVIFSATSKFIQVDNLTTGPFTLHVKNPLTAGVIVPQGKSKLLYCNTVQIEDSNTSKEDTGIAASLDAVVVSNANATYLKPLVTPIVSTGGTVVLTAPQNLSTAFEVSGVLSSNLIVVVANVMHQFTVDNKTTGPFTVEFKTAAGLGIIVPQTVPATIVLMYANGVDVEALTGSSAVGSGTVTSVSVVTANGLAGTVATPGSTPAITLSTTVSGLVKGDGTTLSAATPGSDYVTPSGSGAGLGVTQRYVGSSTNLDTALLNMDDAISSMGDTGFTSWGGTGAYYSITANVLTLLRPGDGHIKGKHVTWAAGQTLGVAFTPFSAHFIYIDINGIIGLSTVKTDALYQSNIALFEVYYDGVGHEVVVENHPVSFDSDTQIYLHSSVGTILTPVTGTSVVGSDMTRVTLGTGGVATDRQVKLVGASNINDHGLVTSLPDSAGAAIIFTIYYTNASGQWVEYGTPTATLPMVYNNSGTITAIGTGGSTDHAIFTCYAVKAEPNSGLPIFIAVPDSVQYSTSAACVSAISAGLNRQLTGNIFEALEPAQLGHLIAFDNVSGGYIETVNISKSTLRSSVSTGGTSVASGVVTDTSNFNNNLSASDTTVQAALDTLDNKAFAITNTPATFTTITGNAGPLTIYAATAGIERFIVTPTITVGNIFQSYNTAATELGYVFKGLATTYASLSSTGLSVNNNITMAGAGTKILGDFSNTTLLSRNWIQTSTLNSATGVGALPNGTSQNCNFQACNNSDPTNASRVSVGISATDASIQSFISGTGTYLPLNFYVGGAIYMSLSATGVATLNKDLVMAGVGAKIQGDFTNATWSSRTLVQTSTVNGGTGFSIVPNGTATAANVQVFNNSDPTNSSRIIVGISSTAATINSAVNGTGTYLPLELFTGGNSVAGISISTTNIVSLPAGQLAFPATQNPSANANTLDDYEEGTWTPTANLVTVVGTPTYSGTYTKIGRLVTCVIHASSTGSIAYTGNSTNFSNLPFATTSQGGCGCSTTNVVTGATGLIASSLFYPGTCSAATHNYSTFTYEV